MAKRRKKRIASRGSVNNIILKSLAGGDKYGYEIIKEVEEFSDGKIKLKQPSLYSSLSRFEDKGIVSSYWGDSDIGGRRHYYHLTDSGNEYYKKEVLKLGRDDEEDEEIDIIEEETTQDLNEEQEIESQEIVVEEIDEDEISPLVDFPNKTEEVIIPDHHFYNSTPIETTISPIEENIVDTTGLDTEPSVAESKTIQPSPWEDVANMAKANNLRANQTALKKLHYNKPLPEKEIKVVRDKDGIFKLRDTSYNPDEIKARKKNIIIDNVIKRTNPNAVYGYTSYTEQNKKESPNPEIIEISEEERKRKNEIFVEKFTSISRNKQKDKEDEELSKTYIQKLNVLLESSNKEKEQQINTPTKPPQTLNFLDKFDDEEEEEEYEEFEEEPTNRLFDYTDEEEIEDRFIDLEDDKEEIDNTSAVSLEPEEFEIRSDNKQYIEEISNYSAPKETIKMNRYENKPSAILSDKTYVLINKIKLVFGIILAILMLGELTITYFILKGKGLIINNDGTLFTVGYIIIGLLALSYIMPIFFSSNEHKLNNFKLKYSIIFGILTFLISVILIYCINALLGFELDNINYFATKLIVPIVMVSNFVILPPIYGLLLKLKKFYD